MAQSVQRIGDANDAGGTIFSTPQTKVFAEGVLVAVNGAIGSGHPPCGESGGNEHCDGQWMTANGSSKVFINGIPVVRTGDRDTCGHIRVGGSTKIYVA